MSQRPSLLFRALLFYGSRLPYHRGKGWLHWRLRRFFNVHVDADFDVVRAGLRWRLNPADFVQADVFWLGVKDHFDLYHLQRLLPADPVVLDVGANFGYYSLVLASRLRKRCAIHAFEPNPPTLARLRTHIALNKLDDVVHVHDTALSDAMGTAGLATDQRNSGRANVVAGDAASTRIRLTTLDAFCVQHNLTLLDAIKIDVEGFEERVLRGGEKALRRWQPVMLIELEPRWLRDKGSSPLQLASLLRDLGYRLFVSDRHTLKPIVQVSEDDGTHLNLFCLPEGR
jgi:FkbM family methyltransferase